MASYVVYRTGPGTPPGWAYLDGMWVDRDRMPTAPEGAAEHASRDGLSVAFARPTGRFETRADGATAEVYEIGLVDGPPPTRPTEPE